MQTTFKLFLLCLFCLSLCLLSGCPRPALGPQPSVTSGTDDTLAELEEKAAQAQAEAEILEDKAQEKEAALP
jgi:hypothetical protein